MAAMPPLIPFRLNDLAEVRIEPRLLRHRQNHARFPPHAQPPPTHPRPAGKSKRRPKRVLVHEGHLPRPVR